MDVSEMKQRAEELTDEVLELAGAIDDLLSSPDTEAKREQLRAICASIRQLEKKDVPVPDDLRRIKTDLTASLSVVDEAQEIKELLGKKLLDVLDLLSIRTNSNGRQRRGNRKRIALSDLIQAGVLCDGMRIIHRAKRSRQTHHGYIRSPGVIEITVEGTKRRFDTPSAAGAAITNASTDGWVYWSVAGDNDEEVPLKIYRDQFLKETKA